MTEEEWLNCIDHDTILFWLDKQSSARKLRLFCCACVRRIWRQLDDAEASRRAVELTEWFVEDQATQEELATVQKRANDVTGSTHKKQNAQRAAAWCASAVVDAASIARSVAWASIYASHKSHRREKAAQAALLREVFGNPFRPVALDPHWLTTDVRALAAGIYADRAFDRMPILADALQDAGCTNEEVLSHCRDTTLAHIRGCWVVDLLLGKG